MSDTFAYTPLQPEKGNSQKRKLFFLKKRFIIPLLSLLLVCATTATCLFLFVFNKRSETILCAKDSELQFSDNTKGDFQLLTEDLLDNHKASPSSIAAVTRISKDGKRIFFPDKISSSRHFKLCWRETGKKDSEIVKIDNDVTEYRLIKGGKELYYLTDDGNLFFYDLKKKERIAKNVTSFQTDDNGKKLLFYTEDSTLLLKNNGKEELIVEDVSEYFLCDDFSVVFYVVDRELFVMPIGKEATKIDNGVVQIIRGYSSGEVYYYKTYDLSLIVADFIVDDLYLPSPSALYNTLKKTTIEHRTTGLFYYDGFKTENILNNINFETEPVVAANSPVVAVSAADFSNTSKVYLSSISTEYQAITLVKEAIKETDVTGFYVVTDEKHSANNAKDVLFAMDDDGKNIYYIYTKYSRSSLHHVEVDGSKVKDDKEIDSSVYDRFLMLTADSKPVYFKSFNDNNLSGNLMINRQLVAQKASSLNCFVNEQNGTFVFYTDYSVSEKMGTLKVTDGKTIATVSKDVVDVVITPSGNLLYLTDEGVDHDMYIFDDKKSTFISFDVELIFKVYDWNEHAYFS